MWADISAARRFRRSWWARLRRLGLPAMAGLHVLGDGASWIWKAAGRALTGCRQTLDIYHAGQHIAAAGKRLYGEGTAEATAFHEHGRELLLKEGWNGVCRLIGEELASEDTPRRRAALDRLLGYFVATWAGSTTRAGWRPATRSAAAWWRVRRRRWGCG